MTIEQDDAELTYTDWTIGKEQHERKILGGTWNKTEDIIKRWKAWIKSIQRMSAYTLPRCAIRIKHEGIFLHDFSDASMSIICAESVSLPQLRMEKGCRIFW